MALINCPECKKQISDKAETCPSCGFKNNLVCVRCGKKIGDKFIQSPEVKCDGKSYCQECADEWAKEVFEGQRKKEEQELESSIMKNKQGKGWLAFVIIVFIIIVLIISGRKSADDYSTKHSQWLKKPIDQWTMQDKQDYNNFAEWKNKQDSK